jgi:alkylresorcinol/alkylpyrone synthase
VRAKAVATGAASAFPPAESQSSLWDGYFAEHFGHRRAARTAFAAAGVQRRHAVANPLVEDVSGWSTGRRMARYLEEAMPLGKEALATALGAAGVAPNELGLLVVASCTGYVTPGLDVRLAQDLDMAEDLQRLLLGHVGCHAALPGLSAARDFVLAHGRPAALLCLELPSLHTQPATDDLEQVVVHALFGDAASALVLEPSDERDGSSRPSAPRRHAAEPSGEREPRGLEIVEIQAVTDVGAAGHMTWDVTDLGFRMGLSRRVPDLVGGHVGPLVDRLLGAHGVARSDIAAWAVHPGGSRVLDVVADRLALHETALAESRGVLADHGNCSSATILLVLERLRRQRDLARGDLVVALAFGPGLTLYAGLLRSL